MRKIKLFLMLMLFISLKSGISLANTLEEAVGAVSQKLFIETRVDKNILRLYSDWGFIDGQYTDAFAGALHSGLLCPNGKLLKPKDSDLSALIRGLVRFSMSSPTFELVGFYGAEQHQFTPDTIFIANDNIYSEYEPEESAYYYALVNKGGRTYVVWKATNQQTLWLYRGTFYLNEGNEYILQNPQKRSFGSWQSVSENGYISAVLARGVQPVYKNATIDGDINLLHLDNEVFILGQLFGEKIKAYYFGME